MPQVLTQPSSSSVTRTDDTCAEADAVLATQCWRVTERQQRKTNQASFGSCMHDANLYVAGPVIPHASCNAILLERVCRPQDWRMHLLVWQVCHDLPCSGICRQHIVSDTHAAEQLEPLHADICHLPANQGCTSHLAGSGWLQQAWPCYPPTPSQSCPPATRPVSAQGRQSPMWREVSLRDKATQTTRSCSHPYLRRSFNAPKSNNCGNLIILLSGCGLFSIVPA